MPVEGEGFLARAGIVEIKEWIVEVLGSGGIVKGIQSGLRKLFHQPIIRRVGPPRVKVQGFDWTGQKKRSCGLLHAWSHTNKISIRWIKINGVPARRFCSLEPCLGDRLYGQRDQATFNMLQSTNGDGCNSFVDKSYAVSGCLECSGVKNIPKTQILDLRWR